MQEFERKCCTCGRSVSTLCFLESVWNHCFENNGACLKWTKHEPCISQKSHKCYLCVINAPSEEKVTFLKGMLPINKECFLPRNAAFLEWRCLIDKNMSFRTVMLFALKQSRVNLKTGLYVANTHYTLRFTTLGCFVFLSRHVVFSDWCLYCFFLKVIVWSCLKVLMFTCLFEENSKSDEQILFWRNATECLNGMLPVYMEWVFKECYILWMKVPASVLLLLKHTATIPEVPCHAMYIVEHIFLVKSISLFSEHLANCSFLHRIVWFLKWLCIRLCNAIMHVWHEVFAWHLHCLPTASLTQHVLWN